MLVSLLAGGAAPHGAPLTYNLIPFHHRHPEVIGLKFQFLGYPKILSEKKNLILDSF